jgi:hypothetical protein
MGNPICENSAKSSCERSTAKEKRDSILSFFSLIPHGQVVNNAWKEPRLGHAQEEPNGKEARKVLCNAHKRCDNAPNHGQSWQPELGGSALEYNVARDFEKNWMVDGQLLFLTFNKVCSTYHSR